ncbi:MAG: winged helix-turn-helix transcriptional regulator [Phycisphaerae bacterium]|nr:winged helix-turn-helix transcriptional regulator [Phycisphaerae bacterium]
MKKTTVTMSNRNRRLCEMKAEIFAAAGHPIRLAIIEFLRDGPKCVCEIAQYVGAEQSNVSRHLGVMLQAGLVTHEKQGLKMIYSLKTPCILGFLECVTNMLRQQAEETQAVLKSL